MIYNNAIALICAYLIIGSIMSIRFMHFINNLEKVINKKEKDKNKANEKIKEIKGMLENPNDNSDMGLFFEEEKSKKVLKIGLVLFGIMFLFPVILIKIFKRLKGD